MSIHYYILLFKYSRYFYHLHFIKYAEYCKYSILTLILLMLVDCLRGGLMKIKANDYTSGEIIKIIREWTELSQKEFGKSLNRSRDSINNIENGRNRVFLDTLLEIAKKYNITITIEKK